MDTHGDGDKNNDVDDGIYDPKTSGFLIDKKKAKKGHYVIEPDQELFDTRKKLLSYMGKCIFQKLGAVINQLLRKGCFE